MPYAIARIYSGSGSLPAEQLAALAIKELAPKLAQGPGLLRYSTYVFSDGQFGSFSVYENQSAASHAAPIAADWVRSSTAMQGCKLVDMMEGEVIYAVQGSATAGEGRLHSLARIYKSNASGEELRAALEQEAADVIRNLPGLARYGVVKLTDGRVGIFSGFDTLENARNSTEQARVLRSKVGSRLAALLPSDPQVIEGRSVGHAALPTNDRIEANRDAMTHAVTSIATSAHAGGVRGPG
jgi:hypothetical protein